MTQSMQRLTAQTRLTNYIPLPRSILSMGLPSTALLLYALLLDRATLSQKHGYSDALGWVYAVFPQEELCQTMHLSPTMVKSHLRALETAGLIRRVRFSRKEANRYYLLIPSDALTATGTDSFPAGKGRKTVRQTDGKPAPNNNKYLPDLIHSYQCCEEESL